VIRDFERYLHTFHRKNAVAESFETGEITRCILYGHWRIAVRLPNVININELKFFLEKPEKYSDINRMNDPLEFQKNDSNNTH